MAPAEPAHPPNPDEATLPASEPPRSWGPADRNTLILFLVVAFVPPILLIRLLRPEMFTNPQALSSLVNELFAKAITAAFVVLATWLAARRQQRPLADYGIPPRQALGWRFWEGTLWGFAMLSALVLFLHALGCFQIQSVALAGSTLYRYAFGWALAFVFVGVSEDFAFRGYLLFLTARRIRFWPASLALSIGFAAAHLQNPGETLFGILQVLGTGLLFCFMIRRTGNLWFAVGFHAAWDWAQSFFYGTPDSGILSEGHFLNSSIQGPTWLSGGSTGPEGSVFSLAVLLFCGLLIHLRFPKALYPDRPA